MLLKGGDKQEITTTKLYFLTMLFLLSGISSLFPAQINSLEEGVILQLLVSIYNE